RVGVGHRDDLVGPRRVVGRGPEILADTFHQIRSAGAAGVHRPLRVGTDDLHPPFGHILEIAAPARDRPAGTDPGDEVGDLAVGVGPDLRAGGFVVAGRALRVGVLIGFPGAVDLANQPVGDAVVTAGVFRWHRRRAHHDLGAVGAQHI